MKIRNLNNAIQLIEDKLLAVVYGGETCYCGNLVYIGMGNLDFSPVSPGRGNVAHNSPAECSGYCCGQDHENWMWAWPMTRYFLADHRGSC